MTDGEAAVSEGERAAVPHEAPEPFGWDGILAIVILLVAAADVRDWMSDLGGGLFLFRALWGLIYLAAAARLAHRFGTEWLTWTFRYQPALCVLLALTFASYLWSLAPLVTLQKAASLLGTTVLGVFIAYTCLPPRLMRVLLWTFTLLIVTSVLGDLVFPPRVADGPIGLSGIMAHKNSFGAAAAFATIFFLVVRVRPIWGVALCTVCLFAMAQARSRTAFVVLGTSLVAFRYLAVAWLPRRATPAMLRRVALGLVLGVSVIPFLVAPLTTVIGKEDPLNGRVRLWAGALSILRERPLTGYGYAVVWGRSDATLLPHIPITAHPEATSAHNSIVNVATELGIPAAIVACAYLFWALSNASRVFERAPSPFSFFALVFVVGMTVMSFAEAHLLRIHSLFWILFVALTVSVKRTLTVAMEDGAPAPPGAAEAAPSNRRIVGADPIETAT